MLIEFLLEFKSPYKEEASHVWTLSLDGASNLKGSGVEIVLELLGDTLIEQILEV